MFAIIGSLVVFIFTLLFVYNWQKQNYWKSKGVPTPSFLPFLGHFLVLWRSFRWERIDKSYKLLRHHGLYGVYSFWSPELFIFDPEMLRLVLVKDSDHFIDRRDIKLTSKEKLFKEMLTMVKGEKWKSLRAVMTPTFTSGKIKSMFPLVVDKVNELVIECEEQMRKHSFVDMKSMFSYYTTDVIGTCAFGIDAHCLKNKGASQFIVSANYLSNLDFKRLVKFILLTLLPRFSEAVGISFANEHMDFFKNVVKETVDLRIKSGQKRGDFLDILLDAFEESKIQGENSKYPMTMDTITAESILFLLAGFDTSSNTLSFLMYLLAANKDSQRILREELQEIIEKEGQFNYQNIMEARYLEACLSETLRLYSPAHFIERLCTKSYRLEEKNLDVPEGMMVGIPVYSLHMDPEYWDDPQEFRPERFLPENKANITPYTYMPFGLGPRNCIGMRFAQMEVKIAIAKLCLDFELDLRPGFTLTLDNGFTTLRPNQNGVQIVIQKIQP